MAGLNKKKKKEKSTNPNIVLIVFVVFLFLVTIGLAIWVYYEHDAQKQLRDSTYNAKKSLEAEKVVGAYFGMLSRELRMALGDTLSEEDIERLNVDRADFQKENFGKFKEEKTKEVVRKYLEELKQDLGVAENNQDFKSSYKKRTETALAKVKELEGKLATLGANQTTMEKFSKGVREKQDEFHETALKRITDGNAELLNAAKQQSKSFKDLALSNEELRKKWTAEVDKISELKDEHEKQLKILKRQLAASEAERKELAGAGGAAGGAAQGSAGSSSPLLLDISTGKPLWDNPVGKIIRVDPDLRQVAINLGSAQGAKPELTFNIFGAGAAGRAEKQLKGSLEIIKILDTSTSLARITSLYDVEGREIPLGDPSRSRIVRETEAPIREGDLLFNLFWGTRVAVAGYVSITGEPSDNPAEQIRQMDDFSYLLQRNGMQVDAQVDLRDGQIRGNLSVKTRYLILGDDLKAGGNNARAAKEDDKDKEAGKDKEKDKEAAKDALNDVPGGDRAKMVSDAKATLVKDAAQRGLIMISAENFATIIGYRRARNANNAELSAFRPTLPYAGTGVGGVIEARPKVEEEKKAPEKKEEMKKEENKEKDNN